MKPIFSIKKGLKTQLKPVLIAIMGIGVASVVFQMPMPIQSAYAVMAEQTAGAATAIIAVKKADESSVKYLTNAAKALKAKGYKVVFAIPSDATSKQAILKAVQASQSTSMSGSSQAIASKYPKAVAYGDGAAINIANALQGQKTNANGAYDLNGNLTATNNASASAVFTNTQNSMNKMKSSVAEPLQSDVEKALSEGEVALMKQLELAGVDPTVNIMPLPTNVERSATRYGYPRTGYFHAGWDFSTIGRRQSPLTWISYVKSARTGSGTGGAGNSVYITRMNNDKYYYFHMKNDVNDCLGKQNFPQDITNPSELSKFCGHVSNSGTDIKDVHLHMGYGVPAKDKLKRRRANVLPRNNGSMQSFTGKRAMLGETTDSVGKGWVNTDVTPYLAYDVPVKNDRYHPWLGSTIRQQFNGLYGTQLPTGADDEANLWPTAKFSYDTKKRPSSSLKPVVNLPTWGNYEWTPDQIAAARSGTIRGMYSGAFPDSMYMASPRMIASFLKESDGQPFSALPPMAELPDVTTQSARQIIGTIGSHRYGNNQWHEAMVKLSTKAMMGEYVAMTASENYIEQQSSLVKQRIEMLLAGLINSRIEPLQGRIEAIQAVATADIVPDIINTKVNEVRYLNRARTGSFDISKLPNGMPELVTMLFEAIAGGESGGDYGAYNTGTNDGDETLRSCYTGQRGCVDIVNRTAQNLVDGSYKYRSSDLRRTFVVGKYQIRYSTLQNAIDKGGIGANEIYTRERQEALIYNYFLASKVASVGRFINGDLSVTVKDAQYRLAKEWAAVGVPAGETDQNDVESRGCLSYYNKEGVNKSHCKSTDKIVAILTKMDQVRRGQVTPDSGTDGADADGADTNGENIETDVTP